MTITAMTTRTMRKARPKSDGRFGGMRTPDSGGMTPPVILGPMDIFPGRKRFTVH